MPGLIDAHLHLSWNNAPFREHPEQRPCARHGADAAGQQIRRLSRHPRAPATPLRRTHSIQMPIRREYPTTSAAGASHSDIRRPQGVKLCGRIVRYEFRQFQALVAAQQRTKSSADNVDRSHLI
jgi:hypothetical protein